MPVRKNNQKFAKGFAAILVKSLVPLLILAIIGLFCFWGLNTLFSQSQHFRIKKIRLIMPEELQTKFNKYNYLIGDPIFSVDLKEVAGYTPKKYPYLEYIHALRRLPNCLVIEAKCRRPVARTAKGLLLDSYGVVFPNFFERDYGFLPYIAGINGNLIPGSAVKSRGLDVAYYLIKEVPLNSILSSFKIESVDVGNANNISFQLKGGPEVRVGSLDIDKKLFVLAKILTDIRTEISQVKYVDLRFKDPVIGYR